MYVLLSLQVYECIYIYIYIYMYACLIVYMYVRMYTCKRTHTFYPFLQYTRGRCDTKAEQTAHATQAEQDARAFCRYHTIRCRSICTCTFVLSLLVNMYVYMCMSVILVRIMLYYGIRIIKCFTKSYYLLAHTLTTYCAELRIHCAQDRRNDGYRAL